MKIKSLRGVVFLGLTLGILICFVEYTLALDNAFRKELLGEPEYKKLDLTKPIYDQKRKVSVGKRTFEIPIVYVSGALSKREKQSGINFSYVLPEFKSKADFKDKNEYQLALKQHLFGGMLIQDAEERPSTDELVSRRLRGIFKNEYVGKEHGMEKYNWYHRGGGKEILYSYVYLNKDQDSHVVDFIECKPQTEYTFPICSHRFIDKNISYDAYYNQQNFLGNWRILKNKTINFLDGFETEN